jgi:eukaryotic-like serine/threonine-protein kinase
MSTDRPPARTPCSICGTQHATQEPCPSGAGVRVGTLLDGKYRLVRLLGQGGMGEVYEGEHNVIGRRVAVKFLLGEYARHPEVALRFVNEARAAGSIAHENIAAVHDVGALPDGTQYLVMEFLDGEDVDKLVQREAPLPVARAAFIVIQVCRGLDLVHQRAVIHRDLKPANLFLSKRADKTDLVKILDFGVAKIDPADRRGATRTGAAIGTAHYMSPEQARGERHIDHRSDLYSLGVILYELLSGKKPHDGDSLLQILHKVMTQPPIPLETARPGLPGALYTVVRRALAPDPAQRFATAADMGDALLPFMGRALPPIRSQPGVVAVPGGDAGETRPSHVSDPGVHPADGSVIGMARSEPSALDAQALSSRRAKARFVAGGTVALAAFSAIVTMLVQHDHGHAVSPAVETPPVVASTPHAPTVFPGPSASAVPEPLVTLVAPAPPTIEVSALPLVRPPPNRTRLSEPRPRTAIVSATAQGAAASEPAARPPSPVASVPDRDRSRKIKIEDDPYQ